MFESLLRSLLPEPTGIQRNKDGSSDPVVVKGWKKEQESPLKPSHVAFSEAKAETEKKKGSDAEVNEKCEYVAYLCQSLCFRKSVLRNMLLGLEKAAAEDAEDATEQQDPDLEVDGSNRKRFDIERENSKPKPPSSGSTSKDGAMSVFRVPNPVPLEMRVVYCISNDARFHTYYLARH